MCRLKSWRREVSQHRIKPISIENSMIEPESPCNHRRGSATLRRRQILDARKQSAQASFDAALNT